MHVRALFLLAMLLCGFASAQDTQPACKELRGRAQIAPQLFHGTWSGTRAGAQMSFTLRNNEEMAGSFEGQYSWRGKEIALAGDNDGLALNLEESDDNSRISGVWELKLCNDQLTGQWLDANFKNAQTVSLRRTALKSQ
jgi:hypothetical protein